MKYGLVGKFTAVPGRRDDLLAILLKAAKLLETNQGCIHYLVSTTVAPNDIWVVETWESKADHDTALEPDDIKALIQQARPYISAMSDQTELQTHGGKGIN